jgi:hypothetical protein
MKVMKFTLKTLSLVAMLAVALPASADWLVSLQPYLNWEGTERGSDVFVSYSFKTKGDYSVNTDVLMQVQDLDGDDTLNYLHKYVRTGVVSPYKYSLGGDWKLNMQYRVVYPTTTAAQASGSYGAVSVRPTFTNSYGTLLNLTVRAIIGADLQRESYEVNPAGAAQPSNNRLGTLALEVIPEFVLAEGVKFTPYVAAAFGLKARTKRLESYWDNAVIINPELTYDVKAVEGLSVGVFYEEEAPWTLAKGANTSLKLFEGDQIRYGLIATYGF